MERLQWRIWVAVALFLIVLAPPVHAAFSLDIVPIKQDIYKNETATYAVNIENFNLEDAKFQVYTIDTNWLIETVPLTLFVPGQGTDTLLLYVRPAVTAPFGTQGVPINFKDLSDEGSTIKSDFVINLRNERLSGRQYEPTVSLDIKMPYEVDPRDPIPLRIEARNRNWLNISELTILVKSPHFSSESVMTLPPLSVRTHDIDGIVIDPLSPPAETEMSVVLLYQGEVVNQLTKNYKIVEYSSISEEIEESSFFFKSEKKVTLTNKGNMQNTAIISVPSSFFKSLFVSSSAPYEKVKNEGTTLVWSIPLSPNETDELSYIENYRILILLLIVLVVSVVAYFLLRSPVIALKEAVGMTKGGDGVSNIKVRIFIRNRSAKLVRNVQLTDKVPSLVDVVKTDAPGSISPTKIAVSEKSGTLLKWHLDVLEPYEERVLTYRAKSKLKIIGRVSLPQSKVRFIVKGKDRVVFSNNIEIVERFRDK